VFRNHVSLRDFQRFFAKLPMHLRQLAQRVSLTGRERTIDLYSRPIRNDQWWSVPAIQRRWNKLVSGDAACDHYAWLSDRYMTRGGLSGLSVGCGEGARELAWARTGKFRRLIGVDITPVAIEVANRAAKSFGLDEIVEFRVGDLADTRVLGTERFDVVIGEHSVHHLTPLREVLTALRDRLVPEGLFMLNEFVGPTRFQWTEEQLRVINHLLPLLPPRLRRTVDGTEKTKEYRPSLLYMRLNDPSEAVESEQILPLMDELFERIEFLPYGGAVLHLLLSRIGHNFGDDDEEALEWSTIIARIEDQLMASGRLKSDFAVCVYRKRS
jgi:SAM-dependent methyltransferase